MQELPAPPQQQVRVEQYVESYPGDLTMEKGIQQMLAQGWRVDQTETRKAAWGPMAGVFTERKTHIVTFVK